MEPTTTARHREYLKAILKEDAMALFGEEEIYKPQIWTHWLTKEELFDKDATDSTKDEAGKWLSDVVRRALLRIDDIARGQCYAAADGKSLTERGLRWLEGCSNVKRIHQIAIKWGKLPDIANPMESIVKEAMRRAELGTVEAFAGPNYEALFGGFSRTPVLLVFPCYLTSSRRGYWDVLQFGSQEELVFIGSKDTLNKVFNKDGTVATRFGLGQPTAENDDERISRDDFRGQMKHTDTELRFLHYGIGHAALDIVLDVVEEPEHYENVRDLAREVNFHLQCESADQQYGDAPSVDELIEHLKGRRRVLVSDMGVENVLRLQEALVDREESALRSHEAAEREGAAAEDAMLDKEVGIRLLRFHHGCGVPVGLGFSLCTVPVFLKRSKVLKELVAAVRRFGRVQSELLEGYGLQLGDGHYGPLLRAADSPLRAADSPLRAAESGGPEWSVTRKKVDALLERSKSVEMVERRQQGDWKRFRSFWDDHKETGPPADTHHAIESALAEVPGEEAAFSDESAFRMVRLMEVTENWRTNS